MKIMTGMKDGWMGEKEEKKGRRERGRELGKKDSIIFINIH